VAWSVVIRSTSPRLLAPTTQCMRHVLSLNKLSQSTTSIGNITQAMPVIMRRPMPRTGSSSTWGRGVIWTTLAEASPGNALAPASLYSISGQKRSWEMNE